MSQIPFMPKIPTGEDLLRKALKGTGFSGPDRRKRKRLTVEELNEGGLGALGIDEGSLSGKDRRSVITKIFDVLDVPRNLIANVIGELVGVNRSKLRKGTLGIPSVYASDILKKLGVRDKIVGGIAGFVGDVALDPLTYLSLGAATGAKLGVKGASALPKALGPAQRVLRQMATTLAKGGKKALNPKALAAVGLTPERLTKFAAAAAKRSARIGPETVATDLFSKRSGGWLAKRLSTGVLRPKTAQDVAKFVTAPGMFEVGRTVARVPFAASGLTSPWGKRAKLYRVLKDMAAGKGDMAAQVAELGANLSKGRKKLGLAASVLKKAESVQEGEASRVAQIKEAVAGKTLTKNLSPGQRAPAGLFSITGAEKALSKAIGGKQGNIPLREARVEKLIAKATEIAGRKTSEAEQLAAKAGALKTSPGAPLPFRLAAEEAMGKTYLPELKNIPGFARAKALAGQIKERLFGPTDSMASRLVAGAKQTRFDSKDAYRMSLGLQKRMKPLVDDVVRTGKGTKEEAVAAINNLLDVNMGAVHPTDVAIADAYKAAQKFGPGWADEAAKYARQHFDEMEAAAKKAGVSPGHIEAYMKRSLTPEAKAAQIKKASTKGSLAFSPERVKRISYTMPDGTEVVTFSNSSHVYRMDRTGAMTRLADTEAPRVLEEAQALVKAKAIDAPAKYDISAAQWNAWRREGVSAPGGSLFAPEFKGEQFVTDPVSGLFGARQDVGGRLAAAQTAGMAKPYGVRPSKDQMLLDQAFEHMVPYEKLGGTSFDIKNTPFHAYVGHQLQGKAYPKPVADLISNFARVANSPPELVRALRYTDTYLSYWKGVTLMHPAYTIRNVTQNLLGMSFQGINPAKATSYVPDIRKVLKVAGEGGDISAMKIGQLPADAVLNAFRKQGLLNSGFVSMVMDEGVWAKTKNSFGRVGRKWFEVNNEIENSMRLSAYATLIEEGMDARQAALKVIKAMPDMADLSQFERSVMRRVFPWYSWARKNGSQMFKLFMDKPAILAGTPKLQRLAETVFVGDKTIDSSMRPSWMDEQNAMQVAGDDKAGTVFLLASWLPFQELLDLFSVAQSPSEFSRAILNRVRPDAKFMVELGSGQDIFRRRPVSPFTTAELLGQAPKAVIGQSGTPLDSLLGIRPLREAMRVAQMPSAGAAVGRGILGGAFQPITAQRGKFERYQLVRDEMQAVRNAMNRAKQVSDDAEFKRLRKDWFKLQAEMLRLGGPGVAKATKETLRGANVPEGQPLFP